VPLLLQRGDQSTLTPEHDHPLRPGDELLFAGRSGERRLLENTLFDDSVAMYVLHDKHVPASWVWRKLARRPATVEQEDVTAGQ
jgi:voltage-gated potassium channel